MYPLLNISQIVIINLLMVKMRKKHIGNFKIDISDGDIAGDIYNRDFVELTVSRIDTV